MTTHETAAGIPIQEKTTAPAPQWPARLLAPLETLLLLLCFPLVLFGAALFHALHDHAADA